MAKLKLDASDEIIYFPQPDDSKDFEYEIEINGHLKRKFLRLHQEYFEILERINDLVDKKLLK